MLISLSLRSKEQRLEERDRFIIVYLPSYWNAHYPFLPIRSPKGNDMTLPLMGEWGASRFHASIVMSVGFYAVELVPERDLLPA